MRVTLMEGGHIHSFIPPQDEDYFIPPQDEDYFINARVKRTTKAQIRRKAK
jgi:hypothetical protein